MKDRDHGHSETGALSRWNRLPSEEGRATTVRTAAGSLTIRREGGVWAIGRPQGAGVRPLEIDLSTKVILPAFANAHAHLDLTHVGPRGYDPADPEGFASWIKMVIAARAADAGEIRASVREGIEKSLRGGVAAVGDIAGIGRIEPVEELRASPLTGASFVEFVGTGARQQASIDAMRALAQRGGVTEGGVRIGLQPHALYSAGPDIFKAAAELSRAHGVGLSTHLAESIEERDLLTRGAGPIRAFIESMGLSWAEPSVPSPTAMFASRAHDRRWLLAHGNDLSDDDIERLRPLGASVAFCARGHAYFGHAPVLGAHRWRDLRRAGVRVCLGTDSIINLPEAQADRISPLDDARLLFRAAPDRGANLASALLEMATTEPARALGLNASLFSLDAGAVIGLIAVEVGEVGGRGASVAVLESDALPELIALSDKHALANAELLWEEGAG